MLAQETGDVLHCQAGVQGGGNAVADQTAQFADTGGYVPRCKEEVGCLFWLLAGQFLQQELRGTVRSVNIEQY